MNGIEIAGMLVFGGFALVLVLVLLLSVALRRRTRTQRSQSSEPGRSAAAVAPQSFPRMPYTRNQYLLTRAERAFYAALRGAVPEGLAIFPQVRLAGLVQVEQRARRDYTHFNRIQAKTVDFVLCDAQTTAPRLVIELDDSSHNRHDRRERDAFVDAVLENAGIPILHVRWQPNYSVQALAQQISTVLHIQRSVPATVSNNQRHAAPPALPVIDQLSVSPMQSTSQPAKVDTLRDIPVVPLQAVPGIRRWVCRECGIAAREGAKFCTNCGATLVL